MVTQDATPPESGNYTFADLHEIDGVIGKWNDQNAGIKEDGSKLQLAAAHYFQVPTGEPVTGGYLGELSEVFRKFALHNEEMSRYTTAHIEKLSASRDNIADTEHGNQASFHFGGGE